MEIDNNIIKSAADYALMYFRKGSRWGESYDTRKIRQEILESVIEDSWAKALRAADAYTLHGSAPIAEAVVSACIHAGVDKKSEDGSLFRLVYDRVSQPRVFHQKGNQRIYRQVRRSKDMERVPNCDWFQTRGLRTVLIRF